MNSRNVSFVWMHHAKDCSKTPDVNHNIQFICWGILTFSLILLRACLNGRHIGQCMYWSAVSYYWTYTIGANRPHPGIMHYAVLSRCLLHTRHHELNKNIDICLFTLSVIHITPKKTRITFTVFISFIISCRLIYLSVMLPDHVISVIRCPILW